MASVISQTATNIGIDPAQRDTERDPTGIFNSLKPSKPFDVDRSVIEAFPVPGAEIVDATSYGESLWGKTTKITVRLPSGATDRYFLKMVSLGETGRHMCEGEYESAKVIHSVSPSFVPTPYAWGKCEARTPETYFLLAEFRDVGEQPADPHKLATALADMHQRSISPTGKFGFHVSTCHARVPQAVDVWEDSWCTVYTRHLGNFMEKAKPILQWPAFDIVCKLTLEKVVPRLLLPLQSDGRVLKPCLIHGDCWDGNTAMDAKTGEAFIFDVCSFYGHNEYDTGNWRAPRHLLSNKAYIKNYKRHFPVSEPVEDWDARNLLYSLTFNIGNTIYIPGSQQRQVVFDDMMTLCKKFCPDDLKAEMAKMAQNNASSYLSNQQLNFQNGSKEEKRNEEEEEEDEVEEEEEKPL